MTIKKINEDFSICKLKDFSLVRFDDEYCFASKTDEEYSLVCATKNVPQNATHCDNGWRAFRIEGVLDFSLIGILSRITALLAQNNIGLFAVSTYNTDYILVKEESFCRALAVLSHEGYEII